MKIIAVVVTYNRLPLLKECIKALQNQTVLPDQILVVNNNSTDGTAEWLGTQQTVTVIEQQNRGGAWGFYTGVKQAYYNHADWIWLMDDDSIPDPTALDELLKALETCSRLPVKTGFIGSKVLWTDGSVHLMNRQTLKKADKTTLLEEDLEREALDLVEFNSFVSLFVSREVVNKVGLPIKEFFIWHDDIEYTRRIIRSGWDGVLAHKSIVLHKTPENYTADIFDDDIRNLWKYSYGIRNELYERRIHKGTGSFIRNILKNFFVRPFAVFFRRTDNRWAFIKVLWAGTLKSINFSPVPEKV